MCIFASATLVLRVVMNDVIKAAMNAFRLIEVTGLHAVYVITFTCALLTSFFPYCTFLHLNSIVHTAAIFFMYALFSIPYHVSGTVTARLRGAYVTLTLRVLTGALTTIALPYFAVRAGLITFRIVNW